MTTTEDFQLSCRKGPLTFRGRLVATVTTQAPTGPKASNYSTFHAYVTTENRVVLHCLTAKNSHIAEEWQVFSSRHEAQEWLGWDLLPIRLYEAAGWPI